MSLKSLPLQLHYEGLGRVIAETVVVPALQRSIRYDRLTSYFTVDSLLACSAGVDSLWARGGRMRLLVGIHAVPRELARAAISDRFIDELVASARAALLQDCARLTDELARNRLGTLALMLREGFIEVRIAAPRDPRTGESAGILHSKRYVFCDEHGEVVVAVGSPNETGAAHRDNYEELSVYSSWEEPARARRLVQSFEGMWEGSRPDLAVRCLDQDFARDLLLALRAQPGGVERTTHVDDRMLARMLQVLREAQEFAFANIAHAALFPHQERALRDGGSRWPLRVLLADEVGLGKTIEAGALLAFARRHLGATRILILAPAQLCRQWQEELQAHFGISAWRYEAGRRAFVSLDGRERPTASSAPLDGAPDVAIVSWHLARGSRFRQHLIAQSRWKPDMVLVDEAHAARRTRLSNGKHRATLLWRLIRDVGNRAPHLVLLTATPMQLQVDEYHGLLMLLGLPDWWKDAEAFSGFLSRVESNRASVELADAKAVAEALTSSIPMLDERMAASLAARLGAKLETLHELPVPLDVTFRARNAWPVWAESAVNASPASLLTVRNTRRGLVALGYRFPDRVFHAPDVSLGADGSRFLRNVTEYLDQAHGRSEAALRPERASALGFVRSVYYQRLVSSFSSAVSTLRRRDGVLKSFLRHGTLAVAGVWQGSRANPPAGRSGTGSRVSEARKCAMIERQYIGTMLANLERLAIIDNDPKLAVMRQTVSDSLRSGGRVLVFSRFTDTVDACIALMTRQLVAEGTGFGRYTGGECWVQEGGDRVTVGKVELCEALRSGRVGVVFCSDAASEGLNLQAARCIVNVDVPWNPAKLEQRIGRIARLGQRAPTVDIHNLWYPGTVEAQMYGRLIARQDLYALAVGEFPDVVGRAIRRSLDSAGMVDTSEVESVLNELRSKSEVRALGRIWSTRLPELSIGGEFRAQFFGIVTELARRNGHEVPVSTDSVRLEIDGVEVLVDREPGQLWSLHPRHPAMTLLERAAVVPQRWDIARRVAVLRRGETPIAFVLREAEGLRVLGPRATGELFHALALGSPVPDVSSEPMVSPTLSANEVTASLRRAFPGRVEIGEIKTYSVAPVAPSPNEGAQFEVVEL